MNSSNRVKKWRAQLKAEGKKTYSITLSVKAQNILNKIKSISLKTYSQIFETCLLDTKRETISLDLTQESENLQLIKQSPRPKIKTKHQKNNKSKKHIKKRKRRR
jgi:hypothetical protein